MLDPFTSLSLASSIFQILDFSGTLLKRANRIRKSQDGSAAELQELEASISQLLKLSSNLDIPKSNESTASLSEDQKEAVKLAESCRTLAEKVTTTLQELKLGDQPGKVKSLMLAVKLERQKGKFAAFEKALEHQKASVRDFTLKVICICSCVDKHHHSILLRWLGLIGARSRSIDVHFAWEYDVANTSAADNNSRVLKACERFDSIDKTLGANVAKGLDETKREIKTILEQTTAQGQSALLKTIIPLLSKMLSDAQDVSVAQRILQSLRFDVMHHRRIGIAETFQSTYEWVFLSDDELEATKGVRTGFQPWLQSGCGVYWISGKAGSGKSTLMKFLSSHENTKLALEKWAGPDNKVVTAAFFFYFYGSDLERTQIGLFKALLFEILRVCPDLTSALCGERWTAGGVNEFGTEDWNFEQLSGTIDRLRSQTFVSDNVETKFCFFIDGLDEYDGDHNDVVAFIKKLSSCSNVKVVASSRPWNVFQVAFGHEKNRILTLQELTQDDIRQFTEGHLNDFRSFVGSDTDDSSYSYIVQEVTEKAQGVFLWVYLVVKELRKSLQNGDSLFDIRRRLERIPPDLEPYFRRMFNTIESFYQEQAAQIFLVCVRSRDPLRLASLAELERNDPLASIFCGDEPISNDDVQRLHTQLASRVNARCLDLLEVKRMNGISRVEFLHRTVRDYLETNDVLAMMTDWAGSDFNPLIVLCSMALIIFKRQSVLTKEVDNIGDDERRLLNNVLNHCAEVEMVQVQTPIHVLDELREHSSQSLLDRACRANIITIFNHLDSDDGATEKDVAFLKICASYKLYIYIDLCQKRSGLFGQRNASKLLLLVAANMCSPTDSGSGRLHSRARQIIDSLMDNDIDPNTQLWRGASVWVWHLTLLVPGIPSAFERPNDNATPTLLYLTESLIRKGARCATGKHVPLSSNGPKLDETETLSARFGSDEAARLLTLRPRLTIHDMFTSIKFPWRNRQTEAEASRD